LILYLDNPKIGSLLRVKKFEELIYEQEYGDGDGISVMLLNEDETKIENALWIPYDFKGLLLVGEVEFNSMNCYYVVLYMEKKCFIAKDKVDFL